MALLVQVIVKVSLVLLTAWGLTRLMSRASAAARHLVWTTAVVTALVLPVVQAIGPSWDLPLLPVSPMENLTPAPEPLAAPSQPNMLQQERMVAAAPLAAEPAVAAIEASPLTPETTNHQPPTTDQWSLSTIQMVTIGWFTIALLSLIRLATGIVWVNWISRRADDVTDEGWLTVLDDAAVSLGVTQPVTLRTTTKTTIPVACGLFSPTVLLPRDAMEWPMERRRVVLLHELAHVARRDCLVQTIVYVARAFYWFNPLVHVAAAKVRAEQERACDDLVLAAGTDGPVYADHLFEIARTFRSERFPAWATLAMARPSQLEGRLVSILDNRRNRRPPTPLVRAAMAAAAAALILTIGGLQLTAAIPDATVQVAQVPDVASDEALISPSPVKPAGDTQAFDSDATVAAGDGVDMLVSAAAEQLAVLPQLDFDFNLQNPDSDPNPDPNPNPNPRFQLQAQNQGNVPVTDETRRRVADALITALNDENEDVREQALAALASMRDPRAIPGLIRAMKDTSPDVREQAINALQQFDTPEAYAAITAALSDADPDVKERAVFAISRYRNTEMVPTLLPLLKDANAEIRAQVARTLGGIADARAIDALTAALKDAEPEVREEAARALGQIARGQRRGPGGLQGLPGRPPTAPPAPAPAPPRAPSAGVQINGVELLSAADMARIEAAAEEAAEEAQLQAIESLRQLRRSETFVRMTRDEQQMIERDLRNLERQLAN
jgi:beta-lactamase regulating signal transducer with metallopeptidase domain